jgi:hypothetical protein
VDWIAKKGCTPALLAPPDAPQGGGSLPAGVRAGPLLRGKGTSAPRGRCGEGNSSFPAAEEGLDELASPGCLVLRAAGIKKKLRLT